jgi:hypothetical protein
MAADNYREPDAWLFADGVDGGPWAATVVDATRLVVYAPEELWQGPAERLSVVTTAGGEPRPFDGRFAGVTVLARGDVPGHAVALVTLDGPRLDPRGELLEDVLLTAVRAAPVADATTELRLGPDPVGLPAPPVLPDGAPRVDRDPWVLVDRRDEEVGRGIGCRIFPWFCHDTGPAEPIEPLIPPGEPEGPGPSAPDR